MSFQILRNISESIEINANSSTLCSVLNVRNSTKIKKHIFLQYDTQEKMPKFRHFNKYTPSKIRF